MRYAVVAILFASACGAPRTVRVPALPFPLDTSRAMRVATGATHWFLYAPGGPWAINALVIDRDHCWEARAVKGADSAAGRTRTSTLLARLDDTVNVIGGVNGDFFTINTFPQPTPPQGIPVNGHFSRGRMLVPPSGKPMLAFDSSGAPHIAEFQYVEQHHVEGMQGGWKVLPYHPIEAVGGRPRLLRDGIIAPGLDTAGGAGFAPVRHPRTAVGTARDGKRLILVVVDGRQKPHSDGMNLRELATLMHALGARDALNLDGGGSSTMIVDSAGTLRVVNRPSDATGERAVGNALAIVRCSR
jgi:hypothetical protein